MRKKEIAIACAALAVILIGTAAYLHKKKNTISPDAVKVIRVMMTCPDEKYYSPQTVTILGEGVPAETAEQKKERKAQEKRIEANWKKAVGGCFEDDARFEKFLSGSAAMRYHAQEKKVRVKRMELTDSNTKNGTQTVKVTASVDGQESPVSILFTYGENGKIRHVTYQ